MSTRYHIKAEQLVNLRNNMIISEALIEEGGDPFDNTHTSNDYSTFAMPNMNRRVTDPPATENEKDESHIYGDITKALYNYSQQFSLAGKIAGEITKADPHISTAMAKEFIEKLLYGIYKMASDPTQNSSFEELMRSIGVTTDAQILTTHQPGKK